MLVRKSFIITPRKHIQIHMKLDSLSVEDAPRPAPNDLAVEALVDRFRSLEQACTLFVDQLSFLVQDDFAPEDTLVQIGSLLKHLVAVLRHLLIHYAALVEVILHKLLNAAKLHVLEE